MKFYAQFADASIIYIEADNIQIALAKAQKHADKIDYRVISVYER